VLATPLLMSPFSDFRGMSGFELRELAVTSRHVTNLATHPSNPLIPLKATHPSQNISTSSLAEKREMDGVSEIAFSGNQQPPTHAVAAARATIVPVADSQGCKAMAGPETEERAESAFRPLPTPPPWSKHFSSHYMRVL
jgi:hypothetical protein